MSVVPDFGLEAAAATPESLSPRPRSKWLAGGSRLGREGVAGLGLMGLLAVACLIVPHASAYAPAEIVGAPLQAPSSSHLFGTDTLGRDVFVRVFAGTWTDLTIAVIGVAISLGAGTLIGVALGVARSRLLHAVVLRVIDAVLAIPFVILVLTLVVVLGSGRTLFGLAPGVGTVILAIVIVSWTTFARLAFAQTLTLRERESVIAVHLLGFSRWRILVRHVLPSVVGAGLSHAATMAVLTVATTASLAFLGAGVEDPTAELGAMMQLGTPVVATAWWVTIFPGLAVLVLGISFALVADALAE